MKRSIALFDLIGIKDAFSRGEAASLLTEFWNAVEAWATGGSTQSVEIPDENRMEDPRLKVRTISDSAILTTFTNMSVDDFYKISLSLKSAIETNGMRSYVIVGRGELLDAPILPAMGGHLIYGDQTRAYENVVGSGEAWVNVYLGDQCLKNAVEWQARYSVYALDGAVPGRAKPLDSREFVGHAKQRLKIHALK